MVEDSRGSDGLVYSLRFVTETNAFDTDGPIVEEAGFVDEVYDVNFGEGNNVVPFYGAFNEVVLASSQGLDRIVAVAGRL